MNILLHISMILSAVLTIALVGLIKNRNTKENYIKKTSKKEWKKLVIRGLLVALLVSIAVIVVSIFFPHNGSFTLTYVTFITAYISTQAYYTDNLIYEIDRHLLRLGYIGNFFAMIGLAMATNPDLHTIQFAFGTYLFLAFVFIFFNLEAFGPSDCRAMAVTLPYSCLLFGPTMGLIVIVSILLISYAWLKYKEKKDGKREMTPIGPIFLIPYNVLYVVAPLVIFLGTKLTELHLV